MQFLKEIKLYILILIGTLTWSLTMVKSGLVYSFGMGFWGPNGHDGIWHLALINHFAEGDLNMPVFSGEHIKNYHIGFDLLLALLHNITTISVTVLYFQIIPPVLALLIGILTYKFVLLWKGSRQQAWWATFFVYFSSGWGWLISLLKTGQIGGESMFWAQQAISSLVNPPFAMSLIFLLVGCIYFLKYQKQKNLFFALMIILSLGLVIEIKVYAGLLALAGLGLISFFKIIKRELEYLLIFLATFILAFALFKLIVPSSGSLVVFKPFWFLETMMALSDRLGWQKFYQAMITYRDSGNYIKAIPFYLIAYAIFLIGNMGTRVVKHLYIVKQIKNPKLFDLTDLFFQTMIIVGCNIPLLFLQKGTPWNTIQFFYYPMFFSGILAGVAMGKLFEKKKKASLNVYAFSILVVFLTLPTTISTLWYNYLPGRPPAKISNEEMRALSFLNKQPQGTVLTYPFDEKAAEKAKDNPPRPLYLYDSTAYVTAFSGKDVYLEDQVNLDIMDYNWKERRDEVLNWLSTDDHSYAPQFLRDKHIKYIYWLKGQRAKLGESQLGITQIFENSEVNIYRVE